MPICIRCCQEKSVEEFAWRWKLIGVGQKVCRECRKRENDMWYRKHRQEHLEKVKARKNENRSSARDFVWDYLIAHPCEICGERDPTVLEFHHLYGKDKAISLMIAEGSTIKKLEKEIAMCRVVCFNCHRRITSKEQGWFRK